MRKHTILFLAANPGETDRLALDREAREIQVELERSRWRDRFELVTRWAAEPLDLLRELRRLAPTVVQFSGHGGDRSTAAPAKTWSGRDVTAVDGRADAPCPGLYFQGPDGQPRVVSAGALREAFGAVGSSVRLVTLNACYSEAAAEALLAHVDCVVGIAGSIGDAAARSFSIGFYGALGERASIDAAYRQACAAIPLEGYPDGNRPRLKVRPGVNATNLILAALPPAELVRDPPAQSSRPTGSMPGGPMSAGGSSRNVSVAATTPPRSAAAAHPLSAPAQPEPRRRTTWLALGTGLVVAAVTLVYFGSRLATPAAVVDASPGRDSRMAAVRRIPRDHMIATASSVLKDWRQYTFGPSNLIDDNLWTSWQPQRKPTGGVGEWFRITLNVPHTIVGFELFNGFQRVDELGDLYRMNSRIENATVAFSDGSRLPVHLVDVSAPTVITLPAPKRCEWVTVTVESIYPGSKWNDVAVSEFHVLGVDP